MYKNTLLFTGISGALMVALGAVGAHYLRDQYHLAEQNLGAYETAVRYQAYHTLALLALAAWMYQNPIPLAGTIAKCFMAGIVLFSGSLYFLALRPLMGIAPDQLKLVGVLTPVGGLCFVGGWILVVVYALKLKK
jgi:uncharacterized membrane protein YgdD (TMEM256/DUF423 family)